MGLIVAAHWTLVYLNPVMLQVSNKHLVFLLAKCITAV